MRNEWQIPEYRTNKLKVRNSDYCLCIPVINEGDKIKKQLEKINKLKIQEKIDIIICDGGSTDNSLELFFLETMDITALLTKIGKGKLSSQLRMGYSYALEEGYKGIITIDGNNKDSVESIELFVQKLKEGYDMVQGSRFIKGGEAINTPKIRHLAVKLIHIPIISKIAGFKYTDTTNGFRGYSSKFLLDERVKPFRDIFDTYELLAYLSVRAPQLGYKTIEVPVTRSYPKAGKTPTKISFFKGNLKLLSILWNLIFRKYNPQ